jgi:hypothetical protein
MYDSADTRSEQLWTYLLLFTGALLLGSVCLETQLH